VHKAINLGDNPDKISPLWDYVLLKRLEKPTGSGMIVLPDTAVEESLYAKVLAVGPGDISSKGVRIPMSVKKEQIVLIRQWVGCALDETKSKFESIFLSREGFIEAVREDV
jgi:chaperonin GroES